MKILVYEHVCLSIGSQKQIKNITYYLFVEILLKIIIPVKLLTGFSGIECPAPGVLQYSKLNSSLLVR
jgi:hypothetical protein